MTSFYRPGVYSGNWKRALRAALAEAQQHRCAYCLCDISKGATIEHCWPRSKKGGTTYNNCVAACYRCNHQRGNGQIWDQYFRVRAERKSRRAIPKFDAAKAINQIMQQQGAAE